MIKTKPDDWRAIQKNVESIFGPPPLFNSEDPQRYYRIMQGYWLLLKPQSVLLKKAVRDLTNATWESLRVTRCQQLLVDDEVNRNTKHQNDRLDEERRRRQQREMEANERANPSASEGANPAEILKAELETFIQDTPEEVDRRFERDQRDRAHARALAAVLRTYERLGQINSTAMKNHDEVLRMVEFYKTYFLTPMYAASLEAANKESEREALEGLIEEMMRDAAKGGDHDVNSQNQIQPQQRVEEPGTANSTG